MYTLAKEVKFILAGESLVSADIINLCEYRDKLQQKELDSLKKQVDEIIENLPEDATTGWYSDYEYSTWLTSVHPILEYVYDPPNLCPHCGKSSDEK